MSRFTGPQHPGAAKQARAEKRAQAEKRQREEHARDIVRRAGIYCDTSGHDWRRTECETCGDMDCYAYCASCPEEERRCRQQVPADDEHAAKVAAIRDYYWLSRRPGRRGWN